MNLRARQPNDRRHAFETRRNIFRIILSGAPIMDRSTYIASACLCLAIAGCADPVDLGPTGSISGTLTRKGQPLAPETKIIFMHPERGFAGVGQTDEAGHFDITLYREAGTTDQLPIGQYAVMVRPSSTAPAPEDAASLESDMDRDPAAQPTVGSSEIPAHYRQAYTSGITREVKKGENTFEIDLK